MIGESHVRQRFQQCQLELDDVGPTFIHEWLGTASSEQTDVQVFIQAYCITTDHPDFRLAFIIFHHVESVV
jgi:hypothetical protein